MTDPRGFFEIHRDRKEFRVKAQSNFRMREYIASYGFKAPRELAAQIITMLETGDSK